MDKGVAVVVVGMPVQSVLVYAYVVIDRALGGVELALNVLCGRCHFEFGDVRRYLVGTQDG